ncbi:hypothetical protein F4695_004340 [Rhizobium soli]|uniref:Uncharacterized protein n=1 Tax=Rhizobium soli TaxID=424798 RepID=A0A7X0MW33_9HYPH|nr:hypothetical protein [Rhizobium soli]MBB6510948.1 hypothetical protein [Rhizobium soli]
MKRYISSDGWGHIFAGNTSFETRWVVDCETRKLVAGFIMEGRGWLPLYGHLLADLEEDVEQNVLWELDSNTLDYKEHGLRRSKTIPVWARSPAPAVVAPAPKSPAHRTPTIRTQQENAELECATHTPPFHLRWKTKEMFFP